jgi:hypothetical protein
MFGRRDVSRSCSHDFSFASCCYYSAPRFLRFHGSSRALTPTPPTRHTHEARATRSSAAVATGTDGEAGAADGVRPPSVRPARGSRGPAALRVRAESGLGQGLRGVQQRHAAISSWHTQKACAGRSARALHGTPTIGGYAGGWRFPAGCSDPEARGTVGASANAGNLALGTWVGRD